ncbi:MAG TPA: hypothetical protein DD435_06455, partial [Cyanobacteria bacterium UBA8530]|nr:hypothetical protein [Cyanobacteria bacterium UBA8530]
AYKLLSVLKRLRYETANSQEGMLRHVGRVIVKLGCNPTDRDVDRSTEPNGWISIDVCLRSLAAD